MTAAGLEGRVDRPHRARAIATFEEWLAPFSFGIGPAGEYVATLTDGDRERLRARCVELLPGRAARDRRGRPRRDVPSR